MLAAVLMLPLLAMGSPWWEDYGTKETFLCAEQGPVVIERNDAQASLLMGRYRLTLFRAQQPPSGEAPVPYTHLTLPHNLPVFHRGRGRGA